MSKWKELYQAALLELNHESLNQKVEGAEEAIFLRFRELAGDSHPEERVSLNNALRALRALQVEKLRYPKATVGKDMP
jgi:hypothetical protein